MHKSKYNYEKAIDVIRERFNIDKKISYAELESILGLESPIGGKNSKINSVIQHLKEKLARYGLELRSANLNVGPGLTTGNKWYNICPLVEKSKTTIKVESGNISNAMQALEKDNQKLFIQNEELKKRCDGLHQTCERLAKKEVEYKKIIASFYSLAMV